MIFLLTLLFLIGILTAIYLWSQNNNSYWEKHGIPYRQPFPILGNLYEIFKTKTCFGLFISRVYSDPRMAKVPVVGMYLLNKPALVVRDLDLVKAVLIKDFTKFSDRFGSCDPHGDPYAAKNLFFIKNPTWREARTKISPVFTSGKIKQMYPLMLEVAAELERHLSTYAKSKNEFVAEVKEICALFTTDNIATIAFGVRANSLQDPNAEFRVQGRKLFNFDLRRAFDFLIAFFMPKWTATLRIKLFTAEFTAFLRKSITFVMEERERTGKTRNDLIDILLAMKKEAALDPTGKNIASDSDFLIAQAGVFLTAGFETSSSAMAFTLYELAHHHDLQQRLREEICEALVAENGAISYENINNLEYLGMVLDEVLRMYPVLPFLDREYTRGKGEEPFTLKPFYDYEPENGMPVYIPVYALQHDPKYWINPEQFDPERFSPENRKKIDPMTYMPFGTGPHNCIGNRIGLLQAKIGLVHFFKNHYITPSEETMQKMAFDPKSMILQADGGIYLKIVNDGLYDKRSKGK